MGTKEKQEGRGGCGLAATSDNRSEGGREVPFFVLAANCRKKRQKTFCRPRDSVWPKNEARLGWKCRGA